MFPVKFYIFSCFVKFSVGLCQLLAAIRKIWEIKGKSTSKVVFCLSFSAVFYHFHISLLFSTSHARSVRRQRNAFVGLNENMNTNYFKRTVFADIKTRKTKARACKTKDTDT